MDGFLQLFRSSMSNGKTSVWKMFPGAFWSANIMEIFERMGWYGFYAVSSLYLTGKIEEGGLGLTSADRGVIQGIATFFLYLLPAVFGALADKYGYKKMFMASCFVMGPSYLLLRLPETFWSFFAVYMLLAIGHGMFKPVVISTIAKTTNEKTGSMGYGIFYMMVNVGGFIGPIIAGIVRGWNWDYVFYASAAWILLLGLTCLFFYKEPHREGDEEATSKSLKEILHGMVSVVGNGRFFLLVSGMLTTLVMGSKWWSFSLVGSVAAIWLVSNLLIDMLLRINKNENRHWLLQPMQIGEGRYMLFLLLMAGFWTSFNQIFLTLPEYIRDYTDTSDLINTVTPLASSFAGMFSSMGADTTNWSMAFLKDGQIKPEHMINLNALGIIIGQVGISYLLRKIKPLMTIISGVLVTVVSFMIFLGGGSGWVVVVAILVFSIGEMMASPKSKEYAGLIAPPGKVGMYKGYFYWCTALGHLFGGLLSGTMYQHYGPVEQGGVDNPEVMWWIFAGLALSTAIFLAIYDKWAAKQKTAESQKIEA